MKRRDPLDRAIDFAFGVPIAATAFMREATRIAAHTIAAYGNASGSAQGAPVEDAGSARPPESAPTVLAAPIEGYDSMDARELLGLIETLDAETLVAVEAYERDNRGRRTVLVKLAATRGSMSP